MGLLSGLMSIQGQVGRAERGRGRQIARRRAQLYKLGWNWPAVSEFSAGRVPPRIELRAHPEEPLSDGRPDFSVWAGEQLVGRIYQKHKVGGHQYWFWGLNAVTIDGSLGVLLHRHDAVSCEDAKARLRAAFERWLEWALAVTPAHSQYRLVRGELQKMGF